MNGNKYMKKGYKSYNKVENKATSSENRLKKPDQDEHEELAF